jgi:DNA-binding CsgD family transcriptional regulator
MEWFEHERLWHGGREIDAVSTICRSAGICRRKILSSKRRWLKLSSTNPIRWLEGNLSGAAVRQADRLNLRETGDLIHEISRARSRHEFSALAIELLQYFRFDYLCMAGKPRGEQALYENFTLIGDPQLSPTDLNNVRLNAVLARVFRHASKDVGCLHLRLGRSSDFNDAAMAGNHLEDFGLGTTSAFFFPADSPKGGRGVVGFLGARKWIDTTEMTELNYLATILFDRICRLTHPPQRGNKLTKREYECLYWTAAGKTSAEIGTILSLSEHTINNYLVAVCHKLDSVNRVHAVAKAIRQGIIS